MKNKYSYIGVSFVVLIFGIIFIPKIISKFENNDIIQNDRLNANPRNSKKKSDLVVMGVVPKFELTDQNEKKISDKDYLGKVYVVEFFFSTCPTICPKMNENMLKIENEFYDNPKFGVASISINPTHDTPQVLKEHAAHLGVKHYNWHFLTGDQDYIFDLGKKFNVYVGANKNAAGGFEHSGLFALIDKEGKIRCRKDSRGNPILYYDGLEDSGVQAIKEDIKKLLEE